MRDYQVMRGILAKAASSTGELSLCELAGGYPAEDVLSESVRLMSDELIVGDVQYDAFGGCRSFSVSGLTDEGRDFWRLVENERVWRIVLETLRAADVDVSYPLLKEVCEEIVKRYVTQFIPSM